MPKLSVRDLPVKGHRVFVRVDFNVPLDQTGTITDDSRITATLPTIHQLLERGALVILGSHLGKPKGKPDPRFSLKPVADHLRPLLNGNLTFIPDGIGSKVVRTLQTVPGNSAVLLENLRFYPGEEQNDRNFAKALAALADFYVNDAFGTAHRAHASTAGMAAFFAQPAAGLLMEKEINYLEPLLKNPLRPFVVIIGGAKVSDKAGVIKNLLPRVDHLLLGGGVAFNFLKARGYNIGKSIWEPELMPEVEKIHTDTRLVLPVDLVVATGPDQTAVRIVRVEQIGADDAGFDIGPETAALFSRIIAGARTVVWAGPPGMFEKEQFRTGTRAIAQALAQATALGATTVVGGGDTAAALKMTGLANRVTHLSTGGGATLEFLEGKTLPGIAALADIT
ncbi:MAG: phosphoglycerate kinase [candidate division WOR-3 bacterium]|jgi:phosphoglycerate kinase